MPNKLRRGIASLRLELLQSYGFMARNWHLTKRYWGWEVVVLLLADQRAVCGVHRAGRRGADRPSARL